MLIYILNKQIEEKKDTIIMYAIEFETDVKDKYIKIPDYEKFAFQHVKVMVMAKPEETKQKLKSKSALGILHQYANPDLQHLEKDAFANAMGEKHAIG